MTLGRGWLFDTNLVSELRKGERCDRRVAHWAKELSPAACYLSRVTVAEIRFGIERAGDPGFRAELEFWLERGVLAWYGRRILDIDERVILRWLHLMSDGRRQGHTYSQPDALIAATALVHDLAVATRNVADFDRAGVPALNPWLAR